MNCHRMLSVFVVIVVAVIFATPSSAQSVDIQGLGQGSSSASTPKQSSSPAPTPTERPSCLIAEKRDPSCCGNGIVEPGFEACDDGNQFDGDGCSAVCKREVIVTTGFEPLLVSVSGYSNFVSGLLPVTGRITFTKSFAGAGTPPIVAVRHFHTDPTDLAQTGTLCIRGVVPEDQRFGPDNVGHGGLGFLLGSSNILDLRVFIQQWLDPLEAGIVDVGPDAIACTDDDPGFVNALVQEEDLKLGLPPSCTGDSDGNGQVTVNELISAVDNALDTCPAPWVLPPQ
jgi:cysteine-rich repeat protein